MKKKNFGTTIKEAAGVLMEIFLLIVFIIGIVCIVNNKSVEGVLIIILGTLYVIIGYFILAGLGALVESVIEIEKTLKKKSTHNKNIKENNTDDIISNTESIVKSIMAEKTSLQKDTDNSL
ncbi:MAG: hypothetical protein IJ031_07595 [Oscillospiraceae bacterium]|nr:hypothetical protein [Oscillospiraceae bacterium]MBQ8884433.1 hypothetical protein [Oscillospiraceae bacterium]